MFKKYLLLTVTYLFINTAYAIDTVKIGLNKSEISRYKTELMTQILAKTEADYGDFDFSVSNVAVNRERHLKELITGKLFNAAYLLTTQESEDSAIAIKIPMDKGIRNYRLFLTHKSNLPKFENISSIEELKTLHPAVSSSWVTTAVLEHHQFNLTKLPNIEGILRLLSANRFDFTLRGVSEVYAEMEELAEDMTDLVVVPNLALYINSPTYIFVSKRFPRLAQRIQTGLEKMEQDGSLDKLIEKYFTKYIEQSDLATRTILRLENPYLPTINHIDGHDHHYKLSKN